MAEPTNACLDDFPQSAGVGKRQQFINRWSQPLAIAPFAVILFIDFAFFGGNDNRWVVGIVFVSLMWAISIVSYSFYLRFFGGIKCPLCDSRFGSGNKCRSCGMQRHQKVPFVIPDLTAEDD